MIGRVLCVGVFVVYLLVQWLVEPVGVEVG